MDIQNKAGVQYKTAARVWRTVHLLAENTRLCTPSEAARFVWVYLYCAGPCRICVCMYLHPCRIVQGPAGYAYT